MYRERVLKTAVASDEVPYIQITFIEVDFRHDLADMTLKCILTSYVRMANGIFFV
jgi:hypothetical protein